MKSEKTMPAGRQENIDDILFDSLKNFELAPSKELKKRIMKDMFFVNIVRYHLYKLIGGFAGAIIISVFSIYLYNVSGKNLNTDIQKTVTPEINVNSIKNPENINGNKTTTFNSNSNLNNIINSNLRLAEIQKKPTENNITTQYKAEKNIQTNINNKIIVKKETENNNIDTKTPVANIPATNINTFNKKQLANKVNDEINNTNSDIIFQDNVVKHSDVVTIADKNSDQGFSDNPENKNLNPENNSEEKLSLIISKGSALPYDLAGSDIFNDTTLFNFKEPVVFKSKFYAVDAFWSGYLHQSIFSNSNQEAENFSLLRNDAVKPVNGYESFGINFNMNNKHLLIQAGISVTKITDDFDYASLLINQRQKFVLTRNNNPFNYTDNGNYFLIDTPGGYWHYTYISDSIIHVSDSTWEHIIDTNFVNIYDSTLKTVYDTLKNIKLRNTYSYFEIPVMAGYEVSYSNFDFALKGGIITSFLIQTSGNNATYNTGELNSISTYLPFRKIFFSGIVSVSVNYKITDRWGIYAEPYYRQSITGMLKNNSILNQRLNTYGVRFGVRYKF